MRTQIVEVTSCNDCPFYSEFDTSELFACLCLMTGQVNENDMKVLDNCPLKRMKFNISLKGD